MLRVGSGSRKATACPRRTGLCWRMNCWAGSLISSGRGSASQCLPSSTRSNRWWQRLSGDRGQRRARSSIFSKASPSKASAAKASASQVRNFRGTGASVPGLAAQVERYSVVIGIGGVPVRVNTTDADFLELLEKRYAGFVGEQTRAKYDFDVDLRPPDSPDPGADVSVTHRSGRWLLQRGDFRA